MRRISLVFGLLAVVGCGVASENVGGDSAEVTAADRVVVTLQLDDFKRELGELRSYDVAGVNIDASQADVVVDDAQRSELAAHYRIVAEHTVPAAETTLEPSTNYKSPADVDAIVHDYAHRFPELATVTSIGRSNEGRDIWAVKISTGGPHKPAILFNSAHHAREVMTVEVGLDTIDTLLTGYGTDPKVTHWVDANDIWVIPMFNVDGSNRVATSDQYWRRNTKGCPASGSCASGTGVDINRNYAYGWASCNGSSTSPRAEDYHGPNAGSEPETQAMMSFVASVRPVLDMSYHSYSELVLYPYGCNGQYAAQRSRFETIGRDMAARLPLDDAPSRTYRAGTPWELLYSADGGDMDWMYHEYNVVAFAIEMNGQREGFRPNFGTYRQKTVQKLRGAWQLLLDRLDQSGIRGVAHDTSGSVQNAQVSLSDGTTRAVNPDGSFHVVLQPGTYHVKVSAPGHATFEEDVAVGASRVDLDAAL